MSSLGGLLSDPSVEKVLHSADYDLRSLDRDWGFRIRSLFDTSVAAAFLGSTSLGLAAVLQEYLSVQVPKSRRLQRADWTVRPLSEEARHLRRIGRPPSGTHQGGPRGPPGPAVPAGVGEGGVRAAREDQAPACRHGVGVPVDQREPRARRPGSGRTALAAQVPRARGCQKGPPAIQSHVGRCTGRTGGQSRI